jgi:hypothetical protein
VSTAALLKSPFTAYGYSTDWRDEPKFDWRCLRDHIALLSPDTIERL